MDLRLHLMARIVIIAAACLCVATAGVLLQTTRDLDAGLRASAESAGRSIELHLLLNRLGYGGSMDFAQVTESVQSPGTCMRYAGTGEAASGSTCQGWNADAGHAPDWFSSLLGFARGTVREVSRAVTVRGAVRGQVIVSADPDREAAQAWHGVYPMLGLTALSLVALCTLTWFTIGHALRPTAAILQTLEHLQHGDLARRVPPFRLGELDRIGNGLNRLAESLQASVSERAELTGRLVRVQEDERRHLARELHDEFAQCLAGINALASVIVMTAAAHCRELVVQGERIAEVASQMMVMLESMLARLRPPELDELGLVPSLRTLIATWNTRSQGRTRFAIETADHFPGKLPDPLAVTIYRIVQECLTNAAKHAQARSVVIRLRTASEGRGELPLNQSAETIVVEVINDDLAGRQSGYPIIPGHGLTGMRERVIALGGELSLKSAEDGGLSVCATLPLHRIDEKMDYRQ